MTRKIRRTFIAALLGAAVAAMQVAPVLAGRTWP
jgi:hypothetical protein